MQAGGPAQWSKPGPQCEQRATTADRCCAEHRAQWVDLLRRQGKIKLPVGPPLRLEGLELHARAPGAERTYRLRGDFGLEAAYCAAVAWWDQVTRKGEA